MVDAAFGFLSYPRHFTGIVCLRLIFNIVIFCKSINTILLCVNIFIALDIDVAAREDTAIRGCF